MNEKESKFIGFDNLKNLTYSVSDGDRCPHFLCRGYRIAESGDGEDRN